MESAKKAYKLLQEIERKDKSPKTLNGCIKNILLKHSNMCQYRDDALFMLYTVLGTGIDWKDGRLFSNSPNSYLNMPPDDWSCFPGKTPHGMEETLEQICGKDDPSNELYQEMKESMMGYHRKEILNLIEVVDNIDIRVNSYSPKVSNRWWYPVSWYACHLLPPKDAQKDFVLGAYETCHLIIDQQELPRGTKTWIEQSNNKEQVKQILEVLKKVHPIN